MDDGTAKSATVLGEGRKALIGALIAIALNPVSLFLGYFLSQKLQAPRMHVEYTVADPWVENHVISSGALDSLRTDPDAVEVIRQQIGQANPDDACLAWLDGSSWEDRCVGLVAPKVKTILSHLTASINAYQQNIKTIAAWEPPQDLVLPPMIDPPSLMTIDREARLNKTSAISMIRGVVKDFRAKRVLVQGIVNELDRIQADTVAKRTGYVDFQVGILNSGDQDGVVGDKADLKFGDGDILRIVADSYTVIRAHSFGEVSFGADRASSSPTTIKKWEALVTGHSQESFHISFPAVAGRKELAADGRLPP